MCPSGTGLGNEHFLRYVFVLDIYCQQLWNVVQLRGCLCALWAQGWRMSGVVNVGGGECRGGECRTIALPTYVMAKMEMITKK